MIPVADILRRCGELLLDEDHVRWEIGELVDWINDAAAAIVVRRPMAGAHVEDVTLVAGAVQRIPDAVEVMDVVRNVGGPAIQRTDRYQLETSAPGWYDMPPVTRLIHYTFDDRKRTTFYVYPPAAEGVQVEALVARVPPKVAQAGELALGREYINAVVNFVCHRAFLKDSEFANGQAGMVFFQAFENELGVQNQSSMAVSPNAGGDA